MEQAPRARARKPDEAGENAARKVEPPHHRVKVVGDPARVKAGVRAKAEAPGRVTVGSLDMSSNQLINDNQRR